MSTPWPPPPDLDSIQELLAKADIEGFIEIHGAPSDEYETEGELLFAQIKNFSTDDLIAENIVPILERIWAFSFNLPPDELAQRKLAIEALARQIAHFFGPEAKPHVRGASANKA